MYVSELTGLVLIVSALVLVVLLTVWSSRTIDRIARKRLGSAREIVKDLNGVD